MSWYGDDTFKQDLLEDLERRLDQHGLRPWDAAEDILTVVGYVIGRMDFKSELYIKAKEDAKYEIEAKIRESLK